jgi:hypothetical protein
MAKMVSINGMTGEASERELSADELAEMRPPQTATDIRSQRDRILVTVVDPLVSNPLRWGDLTAEQQQAWTAYRRVLLDIPQQAGFPANVIWPTEPK